MKVKMQLSKLPDVFCRMSESAFGENGFSVLSGF